MGHEIEAGRSYASYLDGFSTSPGSRTRDRSDEKTNNKLYTLDQDGPEWTRPGACDTTTAPKYGTHAKIKRTQHKNECDKSPRRHAHKPQKKRRACGVAALSELCGELQRAAGATVRLVELLQAKDPVSDAARASLPAVSDHDAVGLRLGDEPAIQANTHHAIFYLLYKLPRIFRTTCLLL